MNMTEIKARVEFRMKTPLKQRCAGAVDTLGIQHSGI